VKKLNATGIKPFMGVLVTIVFIDGNFALTGIIDFVYADSILFSTTKETSLIRLDQIKQIKMKKGGKTK